MWPKSGQQTVYSTHLSVFHLLVNKETGGGRGPRAIEDILTLFVTCGDLHYKRVGQSSVSWWRWSCIPRCSKLKEWGSIKEPAFLECQRTPKLQKLKFIDNSPKLFKPLSATLCPRLSRSAGYNGALWPSCTERKRAAFHSRPRHTAERKMSPLSELASACRTLHPLHLFPITFWITLLLFIFPPALSWPSWQLPLSRFPSLNEIARAVCLSEEGE